MLAMVNIKMMLLVLIINFLMLKYKIVLIPVFLCIVGVIILPIILFYSIKEKDNKFAIFILVLLIGVTSIITGTGYKKYNNSDISLKAIIFEGIIKLENK